MSGGQEGEEHMLTLKRLDGSLLLSVPLASIKSDLFPVKSLRERAAELLEVPANYVSLIHGPEELLDDSKRLNEVLEKTDLAEPVLALKRPCPARPEEYEQHIVVGVKNEFADCVRSTPLEFPEPKGININMMPFVLGKKESLPEDYHGYWDIIRACRFSYAELSQGKIGFLTIQESHTEAGSSQRRPGLHVEASKVRMKEGGKLTERMHHWGFSLGTTRTGGLYMASNVSNSTRIWNSKLDPPEKVVGLLGDCEHLRDSLGEGVCMKAGELWWFTDTTPHESVPLKEPAYRQYIRVVTSSVSIWYAAHSTPNPLGVVPDPEITTVVTYDKFEQAGLNASSSCLAGGEEPPKSGDSSKEVVKHDKFEQAGLNTSSCPAGAAGPAKRFDGIKCTVQ